jgi:hypothetical protein
MLCSSLSRIAIGAAIPFTLAGQSIRGRVVEPGRSPLVGALVELRGVGGNSLQTVLTSPSGAFQLTAPAPGRYFYRIAAIGYQPRSLVAVEVPDTGVAVGEIVLQRMVMRLPDLIAAGRGRYCGKSGIADDVFGRLLESAHTALQIIQATIETGRVGFQVAVVNTRTVFGAINNFEVADTVIQPLTKWPVESIDPDTLRIVGFSRDLEPGNESTRWYFEMKNLPKWMAEAAAGGDMQFTRLSSGLWITKNWAMWAPRAGISEFDRRIRVAGQVETHGWVTRIFGNDSAGRPPS